jgi:hypothetical protein
LLGGVVKPVERGEVSSNIDSVYPLGRTIDAHRRTAAGESTAKLVVLPRVDEFDAAYDRTREAGSRS